MLKEKLKAALKKAGLKEELAEAINITDESQIEGIVVGLQATQSSDTQINFAEVLGSSEFTEFITNTGFDGVLKLSKSLQSEHDKKVTAGIKTFQDKYFKKINGGNDDDDDDDPNQKGNKAMLDLIQKLNDKIDNLEKSKTTETKLEQAKAVIKGSKILTDKLKEKWLNRIDLDSETSFEDQLKELEGEYQEVHKDIVGDTADDGLPTGGSGDDKKPSEEFIADVVDSVI